MLKLEAGMEVAREQRGRGSPVYTIQQQIDVFKTERTQRHSSGGTRLRRASSTASCERVYSTQKTLKQVCSRSARAAVSYMMVSMTVISCLQREKPVVLMSTSSSSLRLSAQTRCLYERCAGPREKQAWRGPGSSEGAGGPSMPFGIRLTRSKPNARGASTPTNPRASDRTSSDNKSQALSKRQSQDVADSSG